VVAHLRAFEEVLDQSQAIQFTVCGRQSVTGAGLSEHFGLPLLPTMHTHIQLSAIDD
jgi:hypothetical protein